MYKIYCQLRDKKGVKDAEVARNTKIAPSVFSEWKKGKSNPKQDKLQRIADYFGVSIEYLMTGEERTTITQSPHPYIPILGKVIAGVPVEAVEDVIGKIQINENLAKTGNFFALEVKGDSMQPRLQEGDIVVVKEQADVESGQIAIVCVNGDEYTIKKIKKSESGITLIPFNPAYEPIFYTNEEIEKLPVEIKGRVVQFHGNL